VPPLSVGVALRAGLYALLRRLPKPLAGLRLRSRSL